MGDAFLDGLPLASELRLKIGYLADGILIQQFLELRFEAGQIVGLQIVQHVAVFETGLNTGVDIRGF